MKGLKSVLFFFMGIAIVVMSFSNALAKDQVFNLKYGAAFGANHPFSLADKAYIDRIANETGNRVKITPFWGSTLINQKESIEQLKKGVCDISFIQPGLATTGHDIHKALRSFFYGVRDGDAALEIYNQVFEKIPEVSGEYDSIKILQISPLMSYALLTRSKPIRSIDDLKGLRIKMQSAYAKTFKDFGVEGVMMPMTEAYISLEKGLIDGVFTPIETLKSFRFAEVAKFCLVDTGCTSSPFPKRAMNLEAYKKLPADIQKVFDDNVEWWTREEIRQTAIVDNDAVDFAKKEGVEFTELPAQDLQKILEKLKIQAQEDASKLDEKGLKGTEIFNEVRKLVEQKM